MPTPSARKRLSTSSVEPLSPNLVRDTLDCLADDFVLSGVKIGMLGTGEVAGRVADFLAASSTGFGRGKVVLDPVLASSSGAPLIDSNGVSVIREQLLKYVGWITPNIHELAILAGQQEPVPTAAQRLKEMASREGNDELSVVVTGGDLDQPAEFLLSRSGEQAWFRGEKVETNSTHGTGCAFSTALLCALIQGKESGAAVEAAKAYVTEALRSAFPVGKGKGPMNHLFPFNR